MKKITGLYITRDRFEIYILLATGCVVEKYEKENGPVFFHFSNKTKCQEILGLLVSKKLKVNAHEMIESIRTAQTIFNNR